MAGIAFSKKQVRKIALIVLVGLVLVFSGVSMMIAKSTYDASFPRCDQPEFHGNLRYSDVEDRIGRKTVHFPSGGNSLAGYLYGESNDKGLVVISHGLGGGAESYLAETLYFVDQGWRVFAFDNTGSHASEGRGTIGVSQSLLDLDAALNYIESDDSLQDLPIMLYGHSWGGYAVCAVLNLDHDIAAVVSIAGFNSPAGLLNEQLRDMMGLGAVVAYPFARAYHSMLFGSMAAVTAVDGINSSGIPVMIIHGDQDQAIAYGGAGIIAQRDEITNPHAVYKTSSLENHNGHNDLFMSDAAVAYVAAKNAEYKELYEIHAGDIPYDLKAAFYQGVDRFQRSELEAGFMGEISRFFMDSLGN